VRGNQPGNPQDHRQTQEPREPAHLSHDFQDQLAFVGLLRRE